MVIIRLKDKTKERLEKFIDENCSGYMCRDKTPDTAIDKLLSFWKQAQKKKK